MKALVWQHAPGHRRAPVAAAKWLDQVSLWQPELSPALVTGEHETAVVMLHGTFDLTAGSNRWPARGARTSPLSGRPMAVFLPPACDFSATDGSGELLMISARQPAARPAEGHEALSQSPLLPLAGSGKAFDPSTGAWQPEETFPTSPESLPPRRMRQLTAGELSVERVLASDYKAATLTIDELVLPAGSRLAVDDIPERPGHDELLLFVRTAGIAAVAHGDDRQTATGDAAFALATPEGRTQLVLTTGEEPAYVVIAYAGK